MAIKTEKLENEIVENVVSLQNKAAEQVHVLGEFHIRLRELEAEKKRMQEFVVSIEAEYDKLATTLNETLKELEIKYPELYDANSPTKRVGGDITKSFETVLHKYPMLSLSNSYSKDDIADFDQKLFVRKVWL